MYPDGTNRHYTIKKMFNRSNAENAENSETECFFSRQSLPSLPLLVCSSSVLFFMRCCRLSSLLFLRIKCDEKQKRCGK
nr:unnamed protein product [Callosobruchus analis]